MLRMKISINRTIEFLKIAFPAILESLVSVIIATIDTKMIACLGKPAISAVSFTTQPKLFFLRILCSWHGSEYIHLPGLWKRR